MSDSQSDRAETLSNLAAAIRGFGRHGPPVSEARSPTADGFGIAPRSLVEWIGEGDGSGVTLLAIAAGLAPDRSEEVSLLIDPLGTLCPLGLVAVGIDVDRVLVVRPRDDREAMWAAEQAMRCPAVDMTVLPVDRLRSHQGRRAKLAVEHGGGIGVLVRPWRARREACWADVRYVVRPLPTPIGSRDRRWRIEVAYQRGGIPGETFETTLCHETGRLRVGSELADPAVGSRAS